VGNTITQNSIFDNQRWGIVTSAGGNLELAPPVLNGLNPVSGTTIPNGKVEVFSDSSDEGRVYEGFMTADGSGNFTWAGSPAGPNVTATVTDAAGNTSQFSIPIQITAVEENENAIPAAFYLSQNFPNPFNPSTTVRFSLKEPCRVVLKVYDIQGREVSTLADGKYAAGGHAVKFDASGLESGVYFYRIRVGAFQAVRKMAVLK